MEQYSKHLKWKILESRHAFIIGEEKERIQYLKELTSCSYLEEKRKTIPIYTDFKGFLEVENKDCERWRLDSFQNNYFTLYITSLMFERLKIELKEEELLILEANLKRLFHEKSITDFDTLKKELVISMKSYKELYEYYEKNGKPNPSIMADVKLLYVIFDILLPNIKMLIPSFSEFIVIINKISVFSKCYTSVINTYISSRSNGYLNIKVGCENHNDWENYYTVNDDIIQYIHDYDVVEMNEWKLIKTKKEQ